MDKLFWLGGKSDNCPQNVLFVKKHMSMMKIISACFYFSFKKQSMPD